MPGQTQPEPFRPFLTSPLLVLATCFAGGIAIPVGLHLSFDDVFGSAAWLLLGDGLCMLVGLILLWREHKTVSWGLVLAGFVLAGVTASGLFENRYPPSHVSHLDEMDIDSRDPVRIEGRLVSSPLATPSGLEFDLEAESIEDRGQFRVLSGKIRLRLQHLQDGGSASATDPLNLRYGDSIRTLARLERPRIYRNPGSFDFRRWMESIEDVSWLGTIKSPLLIEKLRERRPFDPAAFFARVRERLLAGIDLMYPPWSDQGRVGAVLKAVILGDRSSLDSETVENFRKTGLYHLLVIAGLHVGILALLAARFLRLFPLRESWREGMVALGLLGYSALVEQRAATVRATLMIIAYLVARTLYREHASLNAVGLAAMILLVYRPPWLFEAGFQLSFAAALVIVGIVAPVLGHTTEPYRKALQNLTDAGLDQVVEPRWAQFRLDVRAVIISLERGFRFFKSRPVLTCGVVTVPLISLVWVVGILIFTAILQLGLLLPMTEIFHRVTIIGIAMNAVSIPIMTLILGLGVPTVALGAMAPAWAAWPARVLGSIMHLLFYFTDLPHLPGWLSYRIPEPPAWVAWGFALAIVAAAWTFGRHARAFGVMSAAFMVFAMLISFHPFRPRIPKGSLEVTTLDCGAGDAFFIVLPDQRTLLLDSGGRHSGFRLAGAYRGRPWDPGENIVSPYLWSRGIKTLDVIVLGEGQVGNLEGMDSVLRNFTVREFWYGRGLSIPEGWALLERAERRGIRLRELASGEHTAYGTSSLEILWPPAANQEGEDAARSPRPQPVAMRISAGESTALVTDNPVAIAETAVPHKDHAWASRLLAMAAGGAQASLSSEFLGWVSPSVEVVSAQEGAEPERVRRSKAGEARVFRTDVDGAVTVEMQGTSMSVRTYRQPSFH